MSSTAVVWQITPALSHIRIALRGVAVCVCVCHRVLGGVSGTIVNLWSDDITPLFGLSLPFVLGPRPRGLRGHRGLRGRTASGASGASGATGASGDSTHSSAVGAVVTDHHFLLTDFLLSSGSKNAVF